MRETTSGKNNKILEKMRSIQAKKINIHKQK